MKAFKLLLLTLFAALGLAAQAQTIEVYKDGQVIDSFSAAQVDSVVYKYAESQARYYYYVGTVKPTAENLATIGTETETINWTSSNPYIYTNFSKAEFYIAIPTEKGKPILKSTNSTLGLDTYSEKEDIELQPFTVGNVEYTIWCPGIVGGKSTFNIYF